MVRIDCHLHVTEVPEHAPEWWVREMYAPWGWEVDSVDGSDIVEHLDATGFDIGMIQGGDIRRTTYHPDHPHDRRVFVPNDYVAHQVARSGGRLYGVAAMDPLRDIPAAVLELESLLSDHLDTKVDVSLGKGQGKLVIQFADLDDLERIYRVMLQA